MTNDLIVRDDALFPPLAIWEQMKEQGDMLVKTGFLPNSIKSGPQAVAIMLKGREIGIPPMQALAQIHIIEGKPTVSPELMLALIYRRYPNAVITFVQLDNNGCVIDAGRNPQVKLTRIAFTMDDAKRAGLAGKQNWSKYPRAMCRSRAIAEMARTVFPDAIMGCSYTPEELKPDAVVDDNGGIDVGEGMRYEEPAPAKPKPAAKGKAAQAKADELNKEFGAPTVDARDQDPVAMERQRCMADLAAAGIDKPLLTVYLSQRATKEKKPQPGAVWTEEHWCWADELRFSCKAKGVNGQKLRAKLGVSDEPPQGDVIDGEYEEA